MKKSMIAASIFALTSLTSFTSLAQADETVHGMVAAVPPVHLQATVVGVERGSRTLTLEGPSGDVVAVQVGEGVPNFDLLRVGDRIDVDYENALLIAVRKVKGPDAGIKARVDDEAIVPTGHGGFDAKREVEVLAQVTKIDHRGREVTLRGAYRTVTLKVAPDVDLKDVKVGDTVQAVFASAAAVRITSTNRTASAH